VYNSDIFAASVRSTAIGSTYSQSRIVMRHLALRPASGFEPPRREAPYFASSQQHW
jgi:hypothetical protein